MLKYLNTRIHNLRRSKTEDLNCEQDDVTKPKTTLTGHLLQRFAMYSIIHCYSSSQKIQSSLSQETVTKQTSQTLKPCFDAVKNSHCLMICIYIFTLTAKAHNVCPLWTWKRQNSLYLFTHTLTLLCKFGAWLLLLCHPLGPFPVVHFLFFLNKVQFPKLRMLFYPHYYYFHNTVEDYTSFHTIQNGRFS